MLRQQRVAGAPRWNLAGMAALAGLSFLACADTAGVVGPDSPGDMPISEFASAQSGAEVTNTADGSFEFLPPLVESSDPEGEFDGALSPVVEICEIADDVCAGWPIAVFTRETDDESRQIQVNSTDGYYYVDWHTDDSDLDPDLFYRIRVVQGGIELGHVDLDPVPTADDLNTVDTGLYFGFALGEVIPIRFHITAEAQGTVPAADLSLTKTASKDTVEIAEELEYTLTVTNAGPDTAAAVVLSDSLPGELAFLSASTTAGTCTEASGEIVCELGDLATDSIVTVNIVAGGAEPGEAENEAEVASSTQDPNPEDNEAGATIVVLPDTADLALTKTASADTVDLGTQIDYTLTVENAGPDVATDVIVTDELPNELGFVSASTSQGSCAEAGGEIVCELGDLEVGASATVELAAQAEEAGDANNEASVTAGSLDANPEDNHAEVRVVVRGDDAPSTTTDGFFFLPPIGDAVPDLGRNNTALSPVVQVCELVDDDCLLPAVAEFDVSEMKSVNAAHYHVAWSARGGDLDSDRLYRIRVLLDGVELGHVTVDPVENGSELQNVEEDHFGVVINRTVPIKFWIGDSPGEGTPLATADLSLTKTTSHEEVAVGDELDYTLTITNAGPDAARAIVEDELADELELVEAVPSQGECAVEQAEIRCDLGEVAAGGSASIGLRVTALEAGVVRNEASVRGTALDPAEENNEAEVEVTVTGTDDDDSTAAADLSVTTALSSTTITVGDEVDYTIEVVNDGPDPATAVTLDADLSSRFDILAISGPGTCSVKGHKLACELGELDAAEAAILTLALSAEKKGKAELEAKVESQTGDPDVENNGSELEVVVDG